MFRKPTTVNYAATSWKCLQCGLRNFADLNRCRRCKSDLSLKLTASKDDKQMLVKSGDSGRSKVGLAIMFAIALALLLGLVLLNNRQDPQQTVEALSEASVQPATPKAEQPVQEPSQHNPQRDEGAREVLADLKHFQDATESGIGYEEYDEKLNQLKADLNNALSASGHNPTDMTFRQEVEGALRDYTAAGNWWKTTIRNSSVFTDADRRERTQVIWSSARTHLDNAERALAR